MLHKFYQTNSQRNVVSVTGMAGGGVGVMGAGGHAPRFEGWGTQYQMSPPRFLNLCVCPPEILHPYKFRLEMGRMFMHISSPKY